MNDVVGSLFGGGGGTGTPTDTTSGTGGDFLGNIGTALSDIGSAFAPAASAAPANTVTSNAATTPPVDPALAAAESITPPTFSTPQGDTAGIGGTLSDQSSGGQPQKQGQQPQQGQDYAPLSAVAGLKKALQQLAGQQRNPYQPPAQPQPLRQAARINTDPTFPIGPGFPGSQPGGPRDIQAGLPTGANDPSFDPKTGRWNFTDPPAGTPDVDISGSPVTAAGTPAAQTPLPPPRPADLVGDPAEGRIPPPGQEGPSTTGGRPTPQTDDQGRQITVKKTGAAKPQPQPSEDGGDQPQPDQPSTGKRGPPAYWKDEQGNKHPIRPGPPPMMGGGSNALPQLARLAMGLIPLIMMAAAGGGRGRRGGFSPFFHHGGSGGHWPYFAPGRGWQLHDFHPGRPWMPMDPRHMHMLYRPPPGMGGGGMDFNSILQGILGGGQQGPGGPQGGGGYPPGMYRDGGTGGDYVKSGNPFTDALTGIESPQGNVVSRSDQDSQGLTLREGGNPNEISQGYFQIQNYRDGGTWGHYAALAGVDAPSPMQASYEDQHRVARLIPISQWGHNTKAQLHRRFGSFPESWTLGQLEDYFGRGAVASTAQKPTQTAAYSP